MLAILLLINMLMSIQHVLLGLQQVCVLILLQQFFWTCQKWFCSGSSSWSSCWCKTVRVSASIIMLQFKMALELCHSNPNLRERDITVVLYISLYRHEGGRFLSRHWSCK